MKKNNEVKVVRNFLGATVYYKGEKSVIEVYCDFKDVVDEKAIYQKGICEEVALFNAKTCDIVSGFVFSYDKESISIVNEVEDDCEIEDIKVRKYLLKDWQVIENTDFNGSEIDFNRKSLEKLVRVNKEVGMTVISKRSTELFGHTVYKTHWGIVKSITNEYVELMTIPDYSEEEELKIKKVAICEIVRMKIETKLDIDFEL